MKRALAVLAVVVVFVLAASVPVMAQPANSINVMGAGLVGPDLTASTFGVEYERLLTKRMSIMGRIATLDYKFDDDVYKEDGDGSGFDVGVRFYPGGNGMRGFYIGGNIGSWSTDWKWTDDQGTSFQTQGDGSTDSFKVEFEVGGRIPLGSDTVSLIPAAHIGSFIGQDSTCTNFDGSPCDQETESGFYVLLGLSLGIAF